MKEDEKSSDAIWSVIESNFDKTLPFVEQTIEKWNSRTRLLGNLKGNTTEKANKLAGSGAASSVFNATIVE